MILEVGVGTVADQQFDQLGRLFVSGDEGCEVERGFSELRFDAVDDARGRVTKNVVDLL